MLTLTWSADAGADVRATAALTSRPFGGNLVLTGDHHRRLDQALEAGLRMVSDHPGPPPSRVRMAARPAGAPTTTAGSPRFT
jgi:hypothetical protein